jgi:antitoxin component YwqK of YwqJK toxin-antitoxin module
MAVKEQRKITMKTAMKLNNIMRKVFFVSLFLTTCSLSLLAQQDSGFTNKAEAKNQMTAGKKEGKWVEYRDSEHNPTSDTNAPFYSLTIYKDDKAEGIKRYYNKKGTLICIYHFTNGKKNGIATDYYDNGKPRGVYPYLYGKMEGVVKTYYESGQLKSEESQKNDKLDGEYKSYYENGNLKVEASYSDGEKNGTFKTYHINGKLTSETNYSNGNEDGTINYNDDFDINNAPVRNNLLSLSDIIILFIGITIALIGCLLVFFKRLITRNYYFFWNNLSRYSLIGGVVITIYFFVRDHNIFYKKYITTAVLDLPFICFNLAAIIVILISELMKFLIKRENRIP